MKSHPIQPLAHAESGVLRFQGNAIVRHLLDAGPFDMNDLARLEFSKQDREQFAQLIGYSLSGYGELPYVSDESFAASQRMADGEPEIEARINALTEMLDAVREGLRTVVPAVFRIHPDDLES